MGTGPAFVLNLDADHELGTRGRYAPTRRVEDAMRPHRARLAAEWLGPDDVLVGPETRKGEARGRVGIAFCPTTRALAELERVGAEPIAHPSMDVLRRVNSRRFSSELGETLPCSTFATSVDDARAWLAGDPGVSTRFRLKRAFGMAGRGQRVVAAETELDRADLAFLDAAIDEGGVRIEPDVSIESEYGLHGILDADGSFELGSIVVQRADARGAWLSTERASPHDVEHVDAALRSEAASVAIALASAGYFGPFGVDSFVYRDLEGERRLVTRSEINARYSMGFLVGFGRLR